MLANKFRSKNVRGMFVHAQNIVANICCSMECCLIWPLCSRTIQLSQVKAGKSGARNMRRSLVRIATSTHEVIFKMEVEAMEKNRMDKTKTRWIDAQISKLMDLCEERYYIWNITHINYRNREMKSQAFQDSRHFLHSTKIWRV